MRSDRATAQVPRTVIARRTRAADALARPGRAPATDDRRETLLTGWEYSGTVGNGSTGGNAVACQCRRGARETIGRDCAAGAEWTMTACVDLHSMAAPGRGPARAAVLPRL